MPGSHARSKHLQTGCRSEPDGEDGEQDDAEDGPAPPAQTCVSVGGRPDRSEKRRAEVVEGHCERHSQRDERHSLLEVLAANESHDDEACEPLQEGVSLQTSS